MSPIQQMLLGAGGGSIYVHPFDDMSNFSGATRIGTGNIIYYSSQGTNNFTDPNSGASKFRFTVVGGGGGSEGDNSGWFSNTGAGGGGAARGEIQTDATLVIGVAQGGGSPATYITNPDSGASNSSYFSAVNSWYTDSVDDSDNGINRVAGRGGVSYVKEQSATVAQSLLRGRGGLIGMCFYHNYGGSYATLSAQYHLETYVGNSGFGSRYGNGFWHNGGDGIVNANGIDGSVTVSNGSTETGGMGGSGYHETSYGASDRHPLDPGTNPAQASNGQNTTYAGGGGGGGASAWGSDVYGNQRATGGTASGLATLLSGSGITPRGGNGTYSNNQADSGTAGGGHGGYSIWTTAGSSRQFGNSNYGSQGIVIVEFINATELGV